MCICFVLPEYDNISTAADHQAGGFFPIHQSGTYDCSFFLNESASFKMNLCSRKRLILPISQPLIIAQTIVPHFTPTKERKKHRDKTTAKAQLQQSYIVLVLPTVILNFWDNSFTTSS